MKTYYIKSKREYQTKTGEDKVIWADVGVLREVDNGKRYITLNHLPNEVFFVFEPRPTVGDTPQTEIELGSDIPF